MKAIRFLTMILFFHQFKNETYIPSFPNADEREDFSDIIRSLDSPKADEPYSYCVLAVEDVKALR